MSVRVVASSSCPDGYGLTREPSTRFAKLRNRSSGAAGVTTSNSVSCPRVVRRHDCDLLDRPMRADRFPRRPARTPNMVSRFSLSFKGRSVEGGRVAAERKRIATAMQESLPFGQLREQMRKDGPEAVTASLKSMPEGDIREILFALVLTTERAAEQRD